MITKATSPGYLYAVTTDSTCIITDVDTRYNLCKAVVNKQGMFAAIGGSVECSDDNAVLTQASTVSGGTRFEVVTTRPETGETGVIYLVPASNSTTENLYEEWVWVDDKWEQIGSAGLNLSNYAQLTTANTFSAANTFNGNLIKKTSGSLADNSVLNRSEMDSRYGRLSESNDWKGSNEFNAIKTTGMISLNSNNTVFIKGDSNTITLHGHVTTVANKSLRAHEISTNRISGISSLKLVSETSSIEFAGDGEINIDSKDNIILNTTERLLLSGMAALSLGCKDASIWLSGDGANGSIALYTNSTSTESNATISMSHKDKNITLDATTIELDAGTVYMEDYGTLKFGDMGPFITKSVISGIPVLDNDARKISLNKQSSTVPFTDKYCVDITPGLHSPYIYSPHINAAYMTVNTISGVKELNAGDLRINANVSIVGYLGLKGTLTAGSEKDTIDVRANLHMQGKNIKEVANISAPSSINLGIKSSIHAYGHSIYEADAVKLARLGASSLSTTPGRIDVEGSLHFPLGNGSYVDPDVVIANAELRAVNLNAILGPDKYGIRVTNTSCQLFGIDFAYGDVWSETNDAIKAQGATPMPGLDSASYFDTIKIKKPAVSIETTGIGSLSFDYATKAYIRTFPNDGGQGIFEFQAGNWTDSDADWIKRGPVDLRKASATALVPTSVLNMEEGDARWGGLIGDAAVGVLMPPNFNPPGRAEVLEPSNIGNQGAYGVAIGPSVTANVYRDIAIGGWLSTSQGKGNNTILGYSFNVYEGVSNAIFIGQGNNTTIEGGNTVFIGRTSSSWERTSNSVVIKGSAIGNSVVAINGTAGRDRAVAIGSDSFAAMDAVALGNGTIADMGGTALGTYCVAGQNELVLQAGLGPVISMQLYGGKSWEDRDTTGYLRFVTAHAQYSINDSSASKREVLTIHKKPLWDAIQRAKDYNYPAQPFVSLVGDSGEVSSALASMKPNTIYHIATEGIDLDLSNMAFDDTIPGIASAELHIEIISGSNPSIIWPDIIVWPDEPDLIVAPTLTGSDDANTLYAIVVRKQITVAGEFLVASVAYSLEY